MAAQPRRTGVLRKRAAQLLSLAGATITAGIVSGQQPGTLPPGMGSKPIATQPAPAAEPGKRVVAFVYGNVPITREELGEFLISRGGMDKIDVLVNKRMIEIEAARRGISVTPLEIEAGLNEDLNGIGVKKDEFIKLVLPRYGKTLYEWTEDVIRPRLLLGKMCRPRVSTNDAELRPVYEVKYGERREAQVIVWPKGNPKFPELNQAVRDTAAANPTEFDKLAAVQPDDGLRASGGRVAAVGRQVEGEDPKVIEALFSLKAGEARWVETMTTWTCVRCTKIIPPDPANTFEKVRAEVEKEVLDKKLNAEIPRLFEEIKQAANPTLTIHVPERPATIGSDGKPLPVAARAPVSDPRVLAVVFHNVPITREELGEFLIARGGYEKLDLLVNRKIIDMEATKRGMVVTPEEIDAALIEDLKGLGLYRDGPGVKPEDAVRQMKADFVQHILPRYGKSMFEWTEDVLKPRLILTKMCRDRVKVTDDDLKRAYEHHYGEKRAAKLIIWPKEEFRTAQKLWDEARQGEAQFDSVARKQRDPNLAAAAGAVAPIGRYGDAESPVLEQILFTLKEGEVSQLFETPAGIACVRCVKILPPDVTVTPDRVRAALEKEVYEKKLAKEIPTFFNELKSQANANVLLKGPPTARENREGVENIIQQAGGPPPGITPKK